LHWWWLCFWLPIWIILLDWCFGPGRYRCRTMLPYLMQLTKRMWWQNKSMRLSHRNLQLYYLHCRKLRDWLPNQSMCRRWIRFCLPEMHCNWINFRLPRWLLLLRHWNRCVRNRLMYWELLMFKLWNLQLWSYLHQHALWCGSY
jgi:hypothetical protein